MSVYSNTEILDAINNGHIVVHPFAPEHVNGSSIDITIGEWYYRTDRRDNNLVYNPCDETEVKTYFGEPQTAITHGEWLEQSGSQQLTNIPLDHQIIVLEPGERILAHTIEFIGIKPPGTSGMQARSTWGRNGLAVCFDAGWGDPGYINRWTMEVLNLNQRHSIVVPVGERIAQMVFYHTGPVSGEYSNLSGKYQGYSSEGIDNLIKNWSPSMMLPRAYRDNRITLDAIKR